MINQSDYLIGLSIHDQAMGGVYTRENWRTMLRSRVVQVSMDRPDLLDERFSNVVQSDELTKRDMEAAGFLGSYVDQDG